MYLYFTYWDIINDTTESLIKDVELYILLICITQSLGGPASLEARCKKI